MKKRNPGRNNCRSDVRWKKCALKECIKYESWKDDEKIKRIVGDRDVTDADSKYSNRGLSDAVIRQLCGLCRCHQSLCGQRKGQISGQRYCQSASIKRTVRHQRREGRLAYRQSDNI